MKALPDFHGKSCGQWFWNTLIGNIINFYQDIFFQYPVESYRCAGSTTNSSLKSILHHVNYKKRFGKPNFTGILTVTSVKFTEWTFSGLSTLGLKDAYIDKQEVNK